MPVLKLPERLFAILLGTAFATLFFGAAFAQTFTDGAFDRNGTLVNQPPPAVDLQNAVPADDALPPVLRSQVVAYASPEPAGTVVIDTAHTFLYLVLGDGKALRYGIGVGRAGFTWSGVERISRKSEWPDWIPPAEMVARQPYLPRWVGGGPGNPLGARALYLGNSDYRIHGTNNPASIGKQVSSGCIRMRNADVIDLYDRVNIGAKVIVLAGNPRMVADDRQNGAVVRGNGGMTARIAVRPVAAIAADVPRSSAAWNGSPAQSGTLPGLY